MPLDFLRLARQHKAQINKADAANLTQISNAYTLAYSRVTGDIDALALAIDDMEEPTPAQVKALPQYKRLIDKMTKELDAFGIFSATIIATAAVTAVNMGLAHSKQFVDLAIGGGFQGLQPNVLIPLLKYLDPNGGLYKRLESLTGNTVDGVIQSIVDGVTAGFNPRKIASEIADAFGGGLTDALRNTRTVQIWSYRDAARANYTASDGIVQGWIWYAELDGDTCMSCIAQHGSIHGLDETLDDHDNGRCAPLPYIPELGNPVEQTGEDWFSGLSEAEQENMMGKEYYAAYKGGAFTVADMSKQHEDGRYGSMRTVTPLWELLGAERPLRTSNNYGE